MDIAETEKKAKRLYEVLEAAPDKPYKGGNSYGEIDAYLRHIYAVLDGAIFDGFDGKRDSAAQEIKYRNYIHNYRSGDLTKLQRGEIYDDLAKALLQERLNAEVGTHYRYKPLNIEADIKLHMQSRAIVGIEDDFGCIPIIFNPYGVVLMNKEIKKAALCHEAAHLALGHADFDYNPPSDRRKMELDANYVGALIYGDPGTYNELNHFSLGRSGGIATMDLEQHMDRQKARLYALRGHEPGHDKTSDREIDRALAEERFHLEYAKDLVYPTREEKAAEVEALQRKIDSKAAPLGKWSRRETMRKLLSEAIEERHIRKGRLR